MTAHKEGRKCAGEIITGKKDEDEDKVGEIN
jgi:hypothetical protein